MSTLYDGKGNEISIDGGGTTVQNDYFTDGGVHLSAYGWEKFRRVAENWMAYQV